MAVPGQPVQQARTYERVAFSADVDIADAAGTDLCKGRSINLSRGGIGFYAERFLPVGTSVRLRVWVARDGRRTAVPVVAIIRWAQAEDRGAVLGAEFQTVLNPTDQALLCAALDRR